MATAVSFTGGKDSMLALHLVSGYAHPLLPQQQPTPPVTLLVTFAPPGSEFKAHPIPIIQALASSLNILHMLCAVHAPYLDSYQQQLKQLHTDHGITHMVTGDMLDVAAGFMEKAVQGTGVQLVRPLWQSPRQDVLTVLNDLHICSRISCVDLGKYQCPAGMQVLNSDKQHHEQPKQDHVVQQQLQRQQMATKPTPADVRSVCQTALCSGNFDAERDLVGQELTSELVKGPLTNAQQLCGADLCGEHGEYHTLVFDAPMMHKCLCLVPASHQVAQAGSYSHAYVVWEQM